MPGSVLHPVRTIGCVAVAFLLSGTIPCSARAGEVLAAQRTAQLLYASTLNWNAGTGSVYVYHAYGKLTSPIRTIPFTAGFPDGLWTDVHGDVFVSVVNAGNNGHGYINEYSPGGTKLLQTYTLGLDGPAGGTFDSAGNMYVADLCGPDPQITCSVFARAGNPRGIGVKRLGSNPSLEGYVGVYPPGSVQPSEILQTPLNIPVGVAVDANKNVFAANNTGLAAWNVVEFPGGAKQGEFVPFQGFPSQVWVGAATFDPQNALVISVNSTIQIFPHEKGRPSRILTKGLLAPDGLAYGRDGSLFAGNYEFEQNEGNVVVFPPGSTSPSRSYAVPYGEGVVSVAIGTAR